MPWGLIVHKAVHIIAGGMLLMAALLIPCTLSAQQPGETKIPKIGKLKGGTDQEAFTGKIQSVDIKLNLLNLKREQDKGSEIFPVKSNVIIQRATGERISLKDLKAGSDVVVYYELKGTQRIVKQIVELSPRKTAAEKKPSPSS